MTPSRRSAGLGQSERSTPSVEIKLRVDLAEWLRDEMGSRPQGEGESGEIYEALRTAIAAIRASDAKPPEAVECPRCGAAIGELCRDLRMGASAANRQPHPERIQRGEED